MQQLDIYCDSVSKKFECNTCLKVYKSLSDLRKHCEMLSHDYPVVEGPLLEGEVRCDICYRTIKSIFYMEIHMKYTHKQDKLYKCDRCGYTTMRKNHYFRHRRHKHGIFKLNFDISTHLRNRCFSSTCMLHLLSSH